jgi:hypothetical protein
MPEEAGTVEKGICLMEGCKKSNILENAYCGLHQLEYFKQKTIKMGKKVCTNCIRGCREQLELTYKFKKCPECLVKDRHKDKKLIEKKRNLPEMEEETGNKLCIGCFKYKNPTEYVGERTENVLRCIDCRGKDKKSCNI